MSRNTNKRLSFNKFDNIQFAPSSNYHDDELEKKVLSILLMDDEKQGEGIEMLISEMFFNLAHKQLFNLILSLKNSNILFRNNVLTYNEIIDYYKKVQSELEYNSLSIELINSIATTIVDEEKFYVYIDRLNELNKMRNIEAFFVEYNRKMLSGEINNHNQVVDDFNEFLTEKERLSVSNSNFISTAEAAETYKEEILKIVRNETSDNALKTHFPTLDKFIKGFKPGQFIILAARPGIGKTAFALNLAKNIALAHHTRDVNNYLVNSTSDLEENQNKKRPKNVAFISLEMPVAELIARTISSTVQIPLNLLQDPKRLYSNEEYKGYFDFFYRDKLEEMHIYFDDLATSKITDIIRKIKSLVKSLDNQLDLIIIDYLQLISTDGSNGNRQNEVATISRALKILALELKIPIMALSQLSRTVETREDKRPQIHDLRESGAIEQDADIIIFLHRDNIPNTDEQNESEQPYDNKPTWKAGVKTTITVAKNRNGQQGMGDILYMGPTVTFFDRNEKQQY